MNEVQEKIVNAIRAAGGSCDWDTAIADLAYPERQSALPAVRALQQQGVLKREVKFIPNVGTEFTLVLLGGE